MVAAESVEDADETVALAEEVNGLGLLLVDDGGGCGTPYNGGHESAKYLRVMMCELLIPINTRLINNNQMPAQFTKET